MKRFSPALAAGWVFCGIIIFTAEKAGAQAPAVKDISPTTNSDVSTIISTGGGYDAWSGSVRRKINDLAVPGAVRSEGLRFTRTYSSSSKLRDGWSWSFDYKIYGDRTDLEHPFTVTFPDGRIARFKLSSFIPGEMGRNIYRSSHGTKERLEVHPGDDAKFPEFYNGSVILDLEDGGKVTWGWTRICRRSPGHKPDGRYLFLGWNHGSVWSTRRRF